MITYSEENLVDILDEIKPLFEEHYLEIERHTDKVKLNVDYKSYQQLQSTGNMHLVTAREDGKLVGYCMSLIALHLHNKQCLMGYNDVLFLKPLHRKGYTAKKMISFAEECLRKKGIILYYISVKLEHDFGKLLSRMDYIPVERVYEKVFVENFKEEVV